MRALVQKQSPKREAARASASRPGVANPTRDARAGVCAREAAPEVVREVLGSEGRPLDAPARLFMESRFGRDFSRVRVHTDAKAAESARSLGALAYASGERIVFASGRYRPATPEGRRLLAHELAHTLQRPSDGLVRRKVDFTQPAPPALADPIPLVLNGRTILGETRPTVNGTVEADFPKAVFVALQPAAFNFSGKEGALKCNVAPAGFNVLISAALSAITRPSKKMWSGAYAVDKMKNHPDACDHTGLGEVRVEMNGKPDSETLFNKVQTHEQQHAADLKRLTASELKPYEKTLLGLKGEGKTEEACAADVYKKIDNRDQTAVNAFAKKWLDSVRAYDKPTGPHHSEFATVPDEKCAKLRVQEL